ncbi:MAG TPA: hypothetical protein VK034_31675, partial [Enhygromyxa sp.]|nr:hypothetical protein [Enhygromyxa sp.]
MRSTLVTSAAALAITACVDAPTPADTAGTTDTTDTTDTADVDESSTETGDAETYTWHRDVQPIVAQKCGTCHVDGDIAPFALTTYEQASSLAPILAPAIASGEMP